MARLSRRIQVVPGALVHVISRFVDGRFLLDERGSHHYLNLLGTGLLRTDWSLVSYAVMSSHIHLGFLAGAMPLRAWALPLHTQFAQWLNRRQRMANPKALGHVFADRPTTRPMCVSRTRFLLGYHHRNPISAGVVTSAEQSTRTSHRAYLEKGPSYGGLDVALGLSLSGFEASASGRAELHKFVMRDDLDFRELANKELPPKTSVATREPLCCAPYEVVCRTALVVGEPVARIRSRARDSAVVLGRRVSLVSWLSVGGRASEMARELNITPSAASRLLSRRHDAVQVRRLAAIVRAALILPKAPDRAVA